MWVPKFPHMGLSQLWGCITLHENLQLWWGMKQSCSPCRELSNGMSHALCTRRNQVHSWLLVIGSQTINLTLDLYFDHNLCFRCPNGWCKIFLNIYISIVFQWYKTDEFWPLQSRFEDSGVHGTPTPTMGVHLGVWGFIPSHSLHSWKHVRWLPGLPLGM
jgi:hypothetical protein